MSVTRYGLVSGRVQGVGFRYFVQGCARAQGLGGWARNLADGRVEVLLSGDTAAVESVQTQVAEGPPASIVERVFWEERGYQPQSDFTTG